MTISTNDDLICWLLSAGLYSVTPEGRIIGPTGVLSHGKPKRYPKLEVRDQDNRVRSVSKHRFIAVALWGPIPDGYTVNHKDGCKWNNDPDNLEVVPHRENIRHSFAMGLQPPIRRGEQSPLVKISDAQVAEIRTSTETCRVLAARHGVSYALVSKIKRKEHRNGNA